MTKQKIGDFILITPALKVVQRLYPETVIAVPDPLYNLYVKHNLFSNLIPQNGVTNQLMKGHYHILDISYPLLGEEVHLRNKSVKTLPKEPFKREQHSSDSYYQALQILFPNLSSSFSRVPFLEIDADLQFLGNYNIEPFEYFTIHTGSDFEPKNWGEHNYEKVICEILKQHPRLKAVGIFGPQDRNIFVNSTPPVNFISVRTSLENVAALLAGTLFHIDNDSGVHHLAGAMNVPSITIFGATGPGTWSSLTKNNYIIWGGPSCSNHCGGSRMIECKDKVCLTSIKPAKIVEVSNTVLGNYTHLSV